MRSMLCMAAMLTIPPAIAGAAPCRVPFDDFFRIRVGETLSAVNAALACAGEEIERTDGDDGVAAHYQWRTDHPIGRRIRATFIDGRLVRKSR